MTSRARYTSGSHPRLGSPLFHRHSRLRERKFEVKGTAKEGEGKREGEGEAERKQEPQMVPLKRSTGKWVVGGG